MEWSHEDAVQKAAVSLRLRSRSRDFEDLMQVGRVAAHEACSARGVTGEEAHKVAFWSAKREMIDWLRSEYGRDPRSAKRTREVVSLDFEGFGRTLAERVAAPEPDSRDVHELRLRLALYVTARAEMNDRRILLAIMASESHSIAARRLGMSEAYVSKRTRKIQARALRLALACGIAPLRMTAPAQHTLDALRGAA